MPRIASRAYVDGARGQPCKLRIPGVCNHDPETTVFAHTRDRHTGKGVKASDISGVDACSACHDAYDRRTRMNDGQYITETDWLYYALRGMQETLEDRIARGIVTLPLDPHPGGAKPKTRKRPEQRAKIQSRGFAKGPKQKIPSRPFPKKGAP